MNKIKNIIVIFILSFIFNISGVFAYISSVVSLSDFHLPVTQVTAVISNRQKNDMGNQVLRLSFVSFNRNVEFRMHDNKLEYTNRNFIELKYNGGNQIFELGSFLYPNDTLAMSVTVPGTKRIELRTSGYFLDTTSISGTWYLSKSDYLADK
ncbi:MAG: hypothetical protein RSE21_00180 [Bacilli bacterium]